VGVVTDYRYRGISQTVKEPAANATFEYTNNPTGLYAGVFASTINWIKASGGGNAPVELDLYGGKRGEVGGGINYDLGGILYYYPNNNYGLVGSNANTFELYGQLGYGSAYAKYSHALTNLFGNLDSIHSYYVDLGANQELVDGYILNLHWGYQHMAGTRNPSGSYKDWKIGLTKDYGPVIAALAYIDTTANPLFYLSNTTPGTGTTVLSLSKNF
jgi:uncharacterized protein (TIGR02001 family)